MKHRIEMVVETAADLTTMVIIEGNYRDPAYVDRMFATAIAPYEADEGRRIVSFKIEKVEALQG
jgi:hypothetical protein